MKQKLISAGLMCLVLAGCDPKTKDVGESFIMPPELKEKGCKIYVMMRENSAATVYALYCPGASTSTTKISKHSTHISIDDTENGK